MDPIFPISTQDFYKHWHIWDCHDTWKKLLKDPVPVTLPAYSTMLFYKDITHNDALMAYISENPIFLVAETFKRKCPLWVTANITQHF